MNWKLIIQELQARGLSQAAIAKRLGKSQGWVSAVLTGQYADLKWSDGEALRFLHAEIAGQPDKTEAA